VLLGRGELDSQSALEIGSLIKQWIDSKRAAMELNLKIAAQGGDKNVHIRIEGGMNALPGTDIIMPQLNSMNGHHGPLIEHAEPPPPNDSATGQVVAQALAQAANEQANKLQTQANGPSGTFVQNTCQPSEGQDDDPLQ
jgi:hypothetical protein